MSRRRPSTALIVAALALVLAMAGGAIAAKQINGKRIKKNTITSKQIKDGSLTVADLAAGTIPAPTPQGPAALDRLVYVVGAGTVPNGYHSDPYDSVTCPAGTLPTGGSAFALNAAGNPEAGFIPNAVLDESTAYNPQLLPHGWLAEFNNASGGSITIVVEAICAPAGRAELPARLRGSGGKPKVIVKELVPNDGLSPISVR